MEKVNKTAVWGNNTECVYIYPLTTNDLVTNMSLEERARWISDLSGIPIKNIVGLLKTPVRDEIK